MIRAASGEEHVYIHLGSASVSDGDDVAPGEPIGAVGRSGNATTCHLHFESWSAPGWHAGGEPSDPARLLRGLDGAQAR